MSKHSKGYFSLPRSLEKHEAWKSYSLRYRAVFSFIVSKCFWKESVYNIAGKDFPVRPGQYFTSMQDLTEEFNRTVVHKEDKLNKTTTHRILHSFSCNFLVERVTVRHAGHEKTLLTIKHSDTYEQFIKTSGTGNGPPKHNLTERLRNGIKRKPYKTGKKPPTNQSLPSKKVVGLPVGEAVGLVGGFPDSEDSAATGTEGSAVGNLSNDFSQHNRDYQALPPENQEVKIVYACLNRLSIDENDKARLTVEFPEELVQKAVSHCTSADFKAKKSLDASIFHYCKNPDHMKLTKEQVSKSKQVKKDNQEAIIYKRKKICEKIPQILVELLPFDIYAKSRFRPNCESVEISNDRMKENVFFNAPDFKNAVIHQMRKCELPIPDLVYEMA